MSATDGWLIALAAVLVALSSLFAMVETALTRVSRTRVEELRRDEVRGAQRLSRVLVDRVRVVTVLLFLGIVTSVSAVAVATFVCVDALPWPVGWAVALAVAVMVVISYVGIGVAARTIGGQHAERVSLRWAGFAGALATLLGPVSRLLIIIGNAITPGRGYREGPFATQAELRDLVDQAGAAEVIADDERQMIHSVFELGDTIAREVMVPRTEMVFVERTRTLRQALSLGLRSGYSRIPVVGGGPDDVVGIVYLKDIARRVFEHHEAEQTERVESLMRKASYVPDSKPAGELLRDMQAERVHMAVVVDEYGGTAGIVTIEDILEEIVGEIADEYDTQAPEVEELPGGAWRVSARMQVDDFADLVGLHVVGEEEGVDTVGGLLAKRLGRVAIPGALVEVEGRQLVAESAAGRRNRVVTVLVRPAPVAPPERRDQATTGDRVAPASAGTAVDG
ncbi:MAG: HlyC/CorC family transporter [Actinomycetota bacterium]|nr:MAG: HlyC/CorC family transporter [Actinomycetota bacterium]